ncbi:sulfatase-like hydrolase/transferase [Isoptericola jiangsuensis]|uniref:sulfatase-like hydrolase/transferase n=1 Tax=Isoptericola jiangsuensis TaxID=548579 RepID=UPI003AAF80EC
MSTAVQRSARPNVVLILFDDMGWGDRGCYEATAIPTPRMDAMARDGVRFDDARSSSYLPSRRTQADVETVLDQVPAVGVEVAVRVDDVAPRRVRTLAGADLPFEVADGYVRSTVSFDAGHCLVVVEGEQ